MDVTFTPQADRISPMRTARFAAPAEKETKSASQTQDKLEISRDGRQTIEKAEVDLSAMTKDEFISMVREQLGEQKLEVNWNAAVDPDGQIWCKAYFDSYVSQAMEFKHTAESAIRDYYAGAYQEALNSHPSLPQQLNFIAAKYLCSWSDRFDASIPADERQWTYTQVKAMLTGTGLRLNDPYALKDIHIPTSEETTKTARQAADDKISELILQAKRSSLE